MRAPKCCILDFESFKIERRPQYPPRPVGVARKMPGERKSTYFAWGHSTGNNCTEDEGYRKVQEAWECGYPILGQNLKFDMDVAETHVCVPRLPWYMLHDTLYLLFLDNPHAQSLSLKPAAERYLNMPPEERDAVEEWLQEHCKGLKQAGEKWGAYIAHAPGTLVGPYANGDNIRAEKLFNLLYSRIVDAGMLDAYDRERRLMPLLLDNERAGVRVDLDRLRADTATYENAIERADDKLRKLLKSPGLNIDADAQMAEALASAGMVNDEDWTLTKTGKRSVSKKNLTPEMVNDPKVASLYGYRNRAVTCLKMFMRTWLEQAEQTGGTIHTNWSSVRNTDRGGTGAATGRMSSSPNLQNLSKDFDNRGDGYVHPTCIRLPRLPLMRGYVLPDVDAVFCDRDYDGQELRIFAHYEDGDTLQAYRDNPGYKIHRTVEAGLATILGRVFPYQNVKNFDFQVLYGGGIPAIMAALNCDEDTARQAIAALKVLLPGYDALNEAIKERGRNGEPIRTWGTRLYYCEESKYVEKFRRVMSFEYKLLNFLIQGSAADCTKEAIIRYHEHPARESRFLVAVHDSICISSPADRVAEEMRILEECMGSVEFDIEMRSEGKAGPNWGDLTDWKG